MSDGGSAGGECWAVCGRLAGRLLVRVRGRWLESCRRLAHGWPEECCQVSLDLAAVVRYGVYMTMTATTETPHDGYQYLVRLQGPHGWAWREYLELLLADSPGTKFACGFTATALKGLAVIAAACNVDGEV